MISTGEAFLGGGNLDMDEVLGGGGRIGGGGGGGELLLDGTLEPTFECVIGGEWKDPPEALPKPYPWRLEKVPGFGDGAGAGALACVGWNGAPDD
jgi:hypothetical protein